VPATCTPRGPRRQLPVGSELLADARLRFQALELRIEPLEGLVGAAPAEERQEFLLTRFLEGERRAAVQRQRGESDSEPARDLLPLVRAADLPIPGEDHRVTAKVRSKVKNGLSNPPSRARAMRS